jgi:hypothetical protein
VRRVIVTLTSVVLLSALLSCGAPPVFSGSDRRQNSAFSLISGTVVASTTARGNAVVLLYDFDRPPPPLGAGRPVSFTTIPAETLFKDAPAGSAGPFVAPYTFSLVPPGQYTVRAFVDTNGDFVPWYSVTSEPNAGDVAGAALDSVTKQLRRVDIAADQTQRLAAAEDVPVLVSDDAKVPVDRPAFEVAPAATSAMLGGTTKVLDLNARPFDMKPVIEARPTFLVRYVDDNQDGAPDDVNADGQPEVWPRVVVRKLAEGDNGLRDENDLDGNGVIDATGVDYEHVSSTGQVLAPDGKPDAVVLAATVDVSAIAAQLVDATGKVNPKPLPQSTLKVNVVPRAFDVSTPSAPQLIRGIPKGRYAVTIVQSTGQTWRVPNELGPPVSQALGFQTVPSQSFVLLVQ